jgi:hypothetical protein
MVVLKALGRLHGVVGPVVAADTAGAASLAEIGASVRVISPLLMDKLDRIRELVSQVNG